MLAFFILTGIAGIIGGLFFLVLTIFWIWMLIDCIQSDRLSGSERILWALFIFFFHCLGALLYFLIGRKR